MSFLNQKRFYKHLIFNQMKKFETSELEIIQDALNELSITCERNARVLTGESKEELHNYMVKVHALQQKIKDE